MKIALAQIDCLVGDPAGNARRIADRAREALAAGASLLVTPELALAGYPPEDLLLRADFIAACDDALGTLAKAVPESVVVVGHPVLDGDDLYNAVSVLRGGEVVARYFKHWLPNHSVFDEKRYFVPGDQPCVFDHEGVRFGINICMDVWEPGPAVAARDAGAEVLLVVNASPFHIEKQPERLSVVRERIAEAGLPLVYVNMVGGQDELVFDGGSFVVDRDGRLTHQFPFFRENLGLVELAGTVPGQGERAETPTLEESVYSALVLGVRDYVEKNRFPGVELGLSGGIDSALTLAVAVDALGPKRVHAVMMPSTFTASMSIEDARTMAETLGVRYSEIHIKPMYDSFITELAEEFDDLPFDTTEENIQARIRGTLLMAMSNKFGTLVLTTGNKSELATGYATLYGDMAGGFAVLKDVLKTLVYRLANWRNRVSPVIPPRVIDRAPSAELRANQTDQDLLPPYELLDGIITMYVEGDAASPDIVAAGFPAADVERVLRMIDRNEFKRRQAPVGIRITRRGFGRDRRYPITSAFMQAQRETQR